MNYSAYRDCRESGVEWLGKIPNHWEVKRLGQYFTERREKVSDKDFPALSVTKNGVVPQMETAAKSDDGDNRKKVCEGDFAINSRSDRKGSSGLSSLTGSVSLIYTVLRPERNFHGRFAHHLFRSYPFQEEFYRYGKGIVADLWSTAYSEMKNIVLGVPPLHEQEQIAEFLDRETARIDDLSAKQERMVELLLEKRCALISQAVTCGLDSGVKTKSSGVEWLGDVPQHWGIKKLGYIARMRSGEGITSENIEECGNYPVYGGNGLRGFTTEYTHDGNYVLIGRQGALCGNINFASDKFWASEHAIVVTPIVQLSFRWLGELLRSMNLGQNSISAAQPGLSVETLTALKVPFPPLSEQNTIVQYIESETARIDALIAKARQAIELMKEHRTSLIAAAVTGKIDVRTY